MAILCPIDFSVITTEVVTLAAALASGMQVELQLLHVLEVAIPPQHPDGWVATQLAGYHALAKRAGARTSTAIRYGASAATILAEARRWPASLLVIGAHGHAQQPQFLMGSTAEEVLRESPCATLLVNRNAVEML